MKLNPEAFLSSLGTLTASKKEYGVMGCSFDSATHGTGAG